MPLNNMSYVAGEDLAPARIVKRSLTIPNAVIYAPSGARALVGITYNGTRAAPIPSVTETLVAAEGEPVRVYGPGDRAEVELGGTVELTNLNLTATGNGLAVAASTGDFVVGIAERAGVAGDKVWCQVAMFELDS